MVAVGAIGVSPELVGSGDGSKVGGFASSMIITYVMEVQDDNINDKSESIMSLVRKGRKELLDIASPPSGVRPPTHQFYNLWVPLYHCGRSMAKGGSMSNAAFLKSPQLRRVGIFIAVIFIILSTYFAALPIFRALLFYPKHNLLPKIVVGLKVRELDQSELEAIDFRAALRNDQHGYTNERIEVASWQRDYYSKLGIPPVSVALDYIYLPKNLRLPQNKFCITELRIEQVIPDRRLTIES
ncbi:MAG: hypothetical protein AB1649_28425, partial [Chloroflexota bacterium]